MFGNVKNWVNSIKPLQAPLERFVFPVLLALWPFVGVRQGVDLGDTLYALANYRFVAGTGSTWDMATFLANRLGRFFEQLPGGDGLVGMRIYGALLIALTALCCYYVLRRIFPGWMVFLGEWLAVSLCWCPTVILYNYLTYFLLTLACLFLFLGVSSVPEKKWFFVLAGLCLGLNVFVRFSNLTQAALILAVWFHTAVTLQKSTRLLPRTLQCVAGYAAGLCLGVLLLLATGQLGAYVRMIGDLFGMTAQASDYTLGSMLLSTASAYLHALRWFFLIAVCTGMGIVAFRLPLFRKWHYPLGAAYAAGIVLLFIFFARRGMYTLNYQDYWSMFGWGMQFLLLSVALDVAGMTKALRGNADERFLACLSLVLILILPLGSNNYTFPVLNCLFVIAPVTLWLLRKLFFCLRGSWNKYPVDWMLAAMVLMLLVQGSLFHLRFAFRDGTDGTPRTETVYAFHRVHGVKTTPETEASLRELQEAMAGLDPAWYKGRGLLTMGEVPGVHYLLDSAPVLSNLWPDLDSYPVEQMAQELAGCDSHPLVVVRKGANVPAGSPKEEKEKLLAAFLEREAYETVWDGDFWRLFVAR